jgi:hypothetical protein
VIRHFYRWMWEDLGFEAPHPARALLYVGAALLISVAIEAFLIVWLA